MTYDIKRKKAQADYELGMTYKEIAKKHGISQNTVSKWKKQFNWKREPKPKVIKYKETEQVKGKRGAPKRNRNSLKHGYYAKYLPDETKEILEQIDRSNPIDILWASIQIQWVAILRAQRLMYVENKEDVTITKVGESTGKVRSETWQVQQPWDKQAGFLNAQSNALGKLSVLIRQYDELLHKNWELVTEEQRMRIDRLKAEVNKVNGIDNKDELNKLDQVLKEIKGVDSDGLQ